ncbi:MAG: baseplate J/gp47 family protein [Treponema sp.]|nr:baseplate J/gp47 family protein [Treponema sp.]
MSDSWINKDEKTIRDAIITIAKQETGLTNFKSTGVLRGFLEVIIRIVQFIYRTAVNPIYKNASLDGAAGFFLSLWGLMLGAARKQESKTVGAFTGTAYGSGTVPAGAWAIAEGTDLRYKVTTDTAFAADTSFLIPVTAEFPGSVYNIGPGSPVRLTRVITGLDTLSAGEGWIETAGQDPEADAPYRQRIKDRWRSQLLGDVKEVYRYYATSVPGVAAAAIIRAPRGPGSTDVIIAAAGGVPSQALLDTVAQALYGHELLCFDVQVKAPAAVPVTIRIEYAGDAGEGRLRLIAETYVYSLGIGGRFAARELFERFVPLGLSTCEILSPVGDVQADAMSIITAAIVIAKETA